MARPSRASPAMNFRKGGQFAAALGLSAAGLKLPSDLSSFTSAPSLVPGKQRVRKAIIDIARERQHHGIAEQARNPPLAWSRAPDGDRDIGADDEAALRVGRVQATTHVIERGAVCGERSRLNVDILEGDVACSNCCEQLVALPL